MVSYDLVSPGRDYTMLITRIKQMGPWAHLLESQWLIVTTMTASEVRDDLKRYIDENDKLVTVDVTADSWATTFSNNVTAWMKEHVTGRWAA
ncbi:MAG: SinR family protein [Baekduiaceae bacterium]